jgi:hypothetical protein
MATITLSFDDMNASVQVGDITYYSSINNALTSGLNYLSSGFDRSTLSETKKLGVIVGGNSISAPITANSITVDYGSGTLPSLTDAFISFAKDKKVNTSSLLGYYADVKFVNNSTEKAELFSVGSGIEESSK